LPEKDVIHWIECNGRWGGVSIPMTAATALVGPDIAGFAVVQETLRHTRLTTQELSGRLADLLFPRNGHLEGLVFLSPAALDTGTSVNMLALSKSQADSENFVAKAMSRLNSVTSPEP